MRTARRCLTPYLLLLAVPGPARAADEIVSDDWYAQFYKGAKAGWSHRRVLRTTEGGRKVWVTESESEADLAGPGGPRLKSASRVVEDEEGRVISYRTSVDPGMGPQTREGTVKGGVVRAVEDGKPREVPYPGGALGPAAVDRAIRKDLNPGTAGKVTAFQTLDAKGTDLSWKAEKTTELTNVLGRHLWLTRLETTEDGGIPDVSLRGPGGREFAGATNFGLWEWSLTEEIVAKAEGEPAALLRPAVIEPDRAIPVSPKPTSARFRLSRSGKPVGDLPEGRSQKVVARGKDGSVEVEVRFEEMPSGTAIARPQAPKQETWRFLAATPLLELEHPRLKETASGIVGGLINSLRSARMIELAVRGRIQPAPANVGWETACEVLSSWTGDSTEAAVLAAGLARSAGIPSRLVGGFVYWEASTWQDRPRPRGAFALHFWVEVHVADGVWFPLDPMRMDGTQPRKGVDDLEGHGGFDATHVAVLVSDLAGDRPFTEIAKPVLDFMDGLAVEVLEVK